MLQKLKYLLYYNNRRYNNYCYINKKRKKYKKTFSRLFINSKTTLLKNINKNKNKTKNNAENLSYLKIILLILLLLLYIQMIYIAYNNYNILLNEKLEESIYKEENYGNYLNNFKKMKKVIYTVNLGKYDSIKNIPKQEGWDYVNIIDWEITEEEKKKANWTFMMIPDFIKYMNVSIIKKQRFIKLHPHFFFKNYEISLYIDSIYILFGNIDNLIIRLLPPEINIVMNEHRTRNKVSDEMKSVLSFKKEKIEVIQIIKERYKKNKFPDNLGLIEASFILRRHNEKDCINIMEKWWNEIKMYSHRDQLSICYVLWKEKKKIKLIDKNFLFNYLERIPHIVK